MLGGLVEYESEGSSGCESPRAVHSPQMKYAATEPPCVEQRTCVYSEQPTTTSNLDYPNLSKFPDFASNSKPDENTLASIKYYSDAMKTSNFNLVEHIRGYRDFGNPCILSNVVEHFEIDQYGTNYPPELFDPKSYPEADYHESLFRGNYVPPPPVENLSVPDFQNDQSGFSSQMAAQQAAQPPFPPQVQQVQTQQQQQTMSRYQSWSSANSALMEAAAAQQGGPSSSSSGHVDTSRVNRTASYNQSLSDITAYATAISVGMNAVYGERSSKELAFDSGVDRAKSGGSHSVGKLAGEKRKSRWDTAESSN